jgi:hypothetical protein
MLSILLLVAAAVVVPVALVAELEVLELMF